MTTFDDLQESIRLLQEKRIQPADLPMGRIVDAVLSQGNVDPNELLVPHMIGYPLLREAIQTAIENNTTGLAAEITARGAADTALSVLIAALPVGQLVKHELTTSFTTTGVHTTGQDSGLTVTPSVRALRRLKATLKVNPTPSGGAPQIIRYTLLKNGTQMPGGMWQVRQENAGTVTENFELFFDGNATANNTDIYKVQIVAAAVNVAVQDFGSVNFSRQLVIEDVGPQ